MGYTTFVHDVLEGSAARYPEKNALFVSGKWHTFQTLNRTANRLAHLLIRRGIRKGDRVAIFIENSFEYVVTYYAILKAGGTTVALNTESTPDDVDYIVRDAGVRLLATSHRLMSRTLIPA